MGSNNYSVFAADSKSAKRLFPINDDDKVRDNFQRDRDRIVYSKEFRRLSGKTQVFASGFDDNMRTRLTHTLEVAQIADTICQSLGLNQTLCEAIAFGHDVGHTPFGHVGERTLNMIMNSCHDYHNYKLCNDQDLGFKHNLQGLRVTMELESGYSGHKGLNLTRFTLWGIANHSKLQYKECSYYSKSSKKCRYRNCYKECGKNGKLGLEFYNDYTSKLNNCEDWTIEAIIVGIADEVAQRHHDIEDGVFGGLIKHEKLKEIIIDCFKEDEGKIEDIFKNEDEGKTTLFLRDLSRFIVGKYVTRYTEQLCIVLDKIRNTYNIENEKDFVECKKKIYDDIKGELNIYFGFDNKMKESDEKLAKYLKNTILLSELAQTMDGKASYVIRRLFKAYLSNPQQLPDSSIIKIIQRCDKNEDDVSASEARTTMDRYLTDDIDKIQIILLRTICDYIAGMTDQYAMQQFNKLYGTNEMRNGL